MEGMTVKSRPDNFIQRDSSLDAVKGFAILLVMLGHCIVLNGLADAYLYDAIAAVQMPLFMAVSGYLSGLKKNEISDKPDVKKWLVVLGKRSVTYLVPFFVWMVIVSFPHCLEELYTELFHLDYGLWFLATLWIISVVHMVATLLADLLAYKLAKRARVALIMRFLSYIVVIGICYLLFFLQGRSTNTFLSPSLTVRYMPFYIAGYLVSYYRIISAQKKKAFPVGIWNTFCVLCGILFIYLVYRFDMIETPDTVTLVIQMVASFAGVFFLFYGVKHFCKGMLQKILAYIGQFTLEIYVLHFRFARILNLSDKNLVPFHVNTILWVIATFIVMSMLTALFTKALKLIWITDLLCFGKIRPRRRKQITSQVKM